MSKPLTPDEIAAAVAPLTGWVFAADALEKTFEFDSFREAMSFMVRVAFEAEQLNHHPDWSNVYNRVVIRLSTHDAGRKVTSKDVDLATRIQRLAWTD